MARRQVLELYKACLRSAAKCPAAVHRETMRAYVQMKFRDKMRLRDTRAIQLLVADGRDELDRMEYYHSMYRSAQEKKVSKQSPGHRRMVSHCPNCNYSFEETPKARFCSECGVQRPTIV